MNKLSQFLQIYFYSLLRRKFGIVIFLSVLVANCSYAQKKEKNQYPQYRPKTRAHLTPKGIQNRPNIIVILTDDMGFSDISSYGGPYSTPNIDQLASQGMRFTKYYSPSPICSPSRVGLLTGMEPNDWNITSFEQTREGNRNVGQVDYLDPIAPTIGRTLKKAGYVTAHFGKWHMGGGRDVYNAPKFARYGFDEHSSTYESPDPDPLLTATDWIWSPQDSVKRWERTGYFVNKTLDFLKRHKGQPAYINLWPDDMHTPWVPNKAQEDQYPKGSWSEENFAKVLTEYDKQIGRLLDGLKELGIYRNTLIIFTSDNGPLPTFERRRTRSMRGSKLSLYQGGVRLPFIARWPGHIPAGEVDSTSVVSGTDIFPTLASIVGVQMPSRYSFDGESREGVFFGDPSQRNKPLFWDYGSHGDAEAFHYPEGEDRSPNLAVRQREWKLLMNYNGNDIQLYNMKSDPHENDNVAELHPKIVNKLKEKLILWRNNAPELSYFR